jgi:ribosomal protein S18 acetylase RimI-like enzyme
MKNDAQLEVQTSQFAAFIQSSRNIWMNDQLSHRPLLRLLPQSDKKTHCLTILADRHATGFACLTEGDQILLSPMPAPAIAALADYIAEHKLEVPGIFAPKHVGALMAKALSALTGAQYRAVKHILHWTLSPPVNLSDDGAQLRFATPDDIDRLVQMYTAMQAEMNTQRPFDAHQMVTAALNDKALFVGEVGQGEITCVGTVDLSDRESQYGEIGHIYTAPSYRGHGFARALIGHLAEEVFKTKSAVFLSSDASDTASRGLYSKMGFSIGAEMVNLRRE